MKNNLTVSGLLKPLIAFVRRFRTMLFFLAVSGGLFAAILVLLSIITLPSSTATSSNNDVSGSFDEKTIQLLEKDTNSEATPKGRASPFVE